MPSPFPGMNPYLEHEDVWHDFHQRFPVVAAELLHAQLAPDFLVRIDQTIYVHELSGGDRRLLGRPDAYVVPTGQDASNGTTAVITAPFVAVTLPAVDEERLPFLEIRDRMSREVVTVIELLSPTNKRPGPDREQYLGKRNHVLRSRANLVEIDLLRAHPRMPYCETDKGDYVVFLSRMEARPQAGVLSFGLRESLPIVPIPLRAPRPDASLDLKHILDRIYDAADYAYDIYGRDPEPRLAADDAGWARQFLPSGQ